VAFAPRISDIIIAVISVGGRANLAWIITMKAFLIGDFRRREILIGVCFAL
jgi:hypothetical protein